MRKEVRYSYSFEPIQSIYPSKVVIHNHVSKYDEIMQMTVQKPKIVRSKKIEKKFHNFELSNNSRNKLIKKVNWLFQCSKSRVIKSYSGKIISNFKINFLTLTLPSEQIHPTAVIVKECFEKFLTEVRNRFKMQNYVWRIEFQKNNNVHFHLVTDTYLDYFVVRSIWNRKINSLGYVNRFAEKMSKMSFNEYVSLNKNTDFETLKKRYIKGRAGKWAHPNSVDTKSANSQNNIAFYISKYIGKRGNSLVKKNPLDNEENSFAIRLWFCSRSLSRLDVITDFVQNAEIPLQFMLEKCDGVKKIVYQYCTVLYYDMSKLCAQYKKELSQLFRNYTMLKNYNPQI